MLRLGLQTANKNLLHDLTECEKLAEDERDALQQTLHATRTEKQRVSEHIQRRATASRETIICRDSPRDSAGTVCLCSCHPSYCCG